MGPRGEVEGWRLLIPASYDVLWTAVVVVLVAVTAAALLVWSRRRESVSRALVDLALILLVPVLGPAAYLAGALRDRRSGRAAAAASTEG